MKKRPAGAFVLVINEHNLGELDNILKEAENGNT